LEIFGYRVLDCRKKISNENIRRKDKVLNESGVVPDFFISKTLPKSFP